MVRVLGAFQGSIFREPSPSGPKPLLIGFDALGLQGLTEFCPEGSGSVQFSGEKLPGIVQ